MQDKGPSDEELDVHGSVYGDGVGRDESVTVPTSRDQDWSRDTDLTLLWLELEQELRGLESALGQLRDLVRAEIVKGES
jgi:hypothetical protein